MDLSPVTLNGRHVSLVPMTPDHATALWEVGADPELWQWTWSTVGSAEAMAGWVAEARQQQATGTALPFVIVERRSGRPVGSTRFASAEPRHRRVEIGWTWVARPWQRTPVNTEAKLLMLGHAFDRWRCLRVELKTDARNERSRQALLRLGATPEGIFRKHGITDAGRVRDTAWYSITDDEWPIVRQGLLTRLERPWAPAG